MDNVLKIGTISRHLCKICEQVDSLASCIMEERQHADVVLEVENPSFHISDIYADMICDELEHIQILTLKLTELIAQSLLCEAGTNEDDDGEYSAGDPADTGVKGGGKEDNDYEGEGERFAQ